MSTRQCCFLLLVLLGRLISAAAAAAPNSDQPESRGPQKGTLFIHGGGGKSAKGATHDERASHRGFVDLVRQVRSVKAPKIVVITTAGGKRAKGKSDIGSARVFKEVVGEANVSVLHTLSREVADSDGFTAPIDAADAVWMNGGEQVYLAQTFLGTKTEKSFRALLDRGGVIGGSSAGAQVQSSFMTRGIVRGDRILGNGAHQRGFGFLTNTALDVHVAARRRNKDLFKLFATQPGQLADQNLDPKTLLGIGIDERTAIIVRQDQFEVVGTGHAYVFNPRLWKNGVKPFYHTLSAGDRYDLRKRRILQVTRPTKESF